jgi:hypothetical protein
MDKRIAHTVAFLLWCPLLLVPEAMRACKYLTNESVDSAKQMAVCRAYAKATIGKGKAPPSNVTNASTVGTLTVSPLTNQTHQRRIVITSIDAYDAQRYAGNNIKAKAKADKEELVGNADSGQ